ncbi:MAG: SPOR domain-containing protein [Betaproteobacteria bacterium]|nr:SPOR domain-containing protein [Betaproteobacteria bacterium]MDE2123299.1 SPOR domain-containing protein [Betaproteobacteria bacterium]MDE2187103.1 SPOR domain-containing protein [Betaproteobacteria bacterium]MDE2325724.1 SPOR domain-containing protein [Betaproteobacteria bacterium]
MKIPGKRGKDDSNASAQADGQAQSEEVLRVRARRRLIGAVALVLTGVVVFPLIFETQPKPVASTMSLVIPSQNQASIVPAPTGSVPRADAKAAAAVAESAPKSSSGSQAAAPAAPRTPMVVPAPGPVAPTQQAAVQPIRSAQQPEQKPAQKPAAQLSSSTAQISPPPPREPQPTQHQIASARQALAALEGKRPDQITTAQAEAAIAQSGHGSLASGQASSSARYVIQAGAYADTKAAHEVRQKIEHAGFKTYTQVVDTQAGKRIRVRVGPFTTREQADKALARIKALGLSAVVLTL